jgi:hypothetical protein
MAPMSGRSRWRASLVRSPSLGAPFAALAGNDHVLWVDADQVLNEVEQFLAGT